MLTKAELHIRNGEQAGQKIPITHDNFRIGRSSDSDLALRDMRVSRQHAAIRHHDGRFYIQDTQSTSGIYLNNKHIEAGEIVNHDLIRLGTTEMEFIIVTKASQTEESFSPTDETRVVPEPPAVIKLPRETGAYIPRDRPLGSLGTPPYAPPQRSYSRYTPALLFVGFVLFVALILFVIISATG